jgi:lipase chaperone LimK
MPFEKKLATLALHARMDQEITQNATVALHANEQDPEAVRQQRQAWWGASTAD